MQDVALDGFKLSVRCVEVLINGVLESHTLVRFAQDEGVVLVISIAFVIRIQGDYGCVSDTLEHQADRAQGVFDT